MKISVINQPTYVKTNIPAFWGASRPERFDADTFSKTPAISGSDIAGEDAKAKYIQNSKYLSLYNRLSSKKDDRFGRFIYDYYINIYHDERINALEELDIEGIKVLEAKCEEADKRCDELDINFNRDTIIKFFADLYYLNPEAYEYAINSDFITERFVARGFSAYDCIKHLNVAALKEIEKGELSNIVAEYVDNSNKFNTDTKKMCELSKYLSANKTEGEITVKRAERDTGMFSSVPLTNKLLKTEIKLMNKFNHAASRMENVSGALGFNAEKRLLKKYTIFDYIESKDELSLGDAMLVMRYLTPGGRKRVLKELEGVTVGDNRFKSTTLSDKFAESWIWSKDVTTISNTIRVAKGTEGRFVINRSRCEIGDNRQHEFIINNKPKKITVTKAGYDEERNMFEIETTLRQTEYEDIDYFN